MPNRTLSLVAALAVSLPGQAAHATICSDGRFSGSVSSSCYKNFYGNHNCMGSGSTHECTRLEISIRTVDNMIRDTRDLRLLDFLRLWKSKAASESPNAGMVLTYVDADAGPQFQCSVYLRKGILNEIGPVLYTFRSRQACENVGRDAFVTFFNTLRNRSAFVSPYDKLLFSHYPVDEVRIHYEMAAVDPAHRAFAMLAQKDQVTPDLPRYEVHHLPAVYFFNNEHRSLRKVAAEVGFENDEAWQAIWSMNYDKVHDPGTIPQGISVAIPEVPSAEDSWVGPFSLLEYGDPYDLAVKLYGDGQAQALIRRIMRTTRSFGMTDMFVPDDLGQEWITEPVFFFED